MPRQVGLQEDNTLVLFTNFSDQDFTWFWDSKPQTFRAGEQVWMERWRANHFAKHLINRELQRKDVSYTPEQRKFYTHLQLDEDSIVRKELYEKCVSEKTVAAAESGAIATQLHDLNERIVPSSNPTVSVTDTSPLPTPANTVTVPAPIVSEPPKKRIGRPPKVKPTEDSFEGK